jgi:hypothetical protein
VITNSSALVEQGVMKHNEVEVLYLSSSLPFIGFVVLVNHIENLKLQVLVNTYIYEGFGSTKNRYMK